MRETCRSTHAYGTDPLRLFCLRSSAAAYARASSGRLRLQRCPVFERRFCRLRLTCSRRGLTDAAHHAVSDVLRVRHELTVTALAARKAQHSGVLEPHK